MTEHAHTCTRHVYCSWTILTERNLTTAEVFRLYFDLHQSEGRKDGVPLSGLVLLSSSHMLCVIPGLQRRAPL